MSNYDAWLEKPFQDSIRQGEELEALEEKYQESAEFKENFEVWQRDCLPNIQARPSGMPFMGLPLDAYLTSDEYSRNLDAFIKAQYVQDEWEAYEDQQAQQEQDETKGTSSKDSSFEVVDTPLPKGPKIDSRKTSPIKRQVDEEKTPEEIQQETIRMLIDTQRETLKLLVK